MLSKVPLICICEQQWIFNLSNDSAEGNIVDNMCGLDIQIKEIRNSEFNSIGSLLNILAMVFNYFLSTKKHASHLPLISTSSTSNFSLTPFSSFVNSSSDSTSDSSFRSCGSSAFLVHHVTRLSCRERQY